MATSGSMLRWEQGLFDGVSLAELDADAAASEPGTLVTLPYFLGEKTPLHDPDLRGAMIGLHLGTTRGDLHGRSSRRSPTDSARTSTSLPKTDSS